ncbi:MAG: MFS transporter [Burkholderiaceae bacterium]
MLVLALFLVGINLRPALSSVAPVLAAIERGTGMSSTGAGLLTTLPVLCFGLFAAAAPMLVRRLSAEKVVFGGMLALAAALGLRVLFGEAGLFLGTAAAGAAIGVVMVVLPGIIKRDFPDRAGLMTGVYTMALCLGAALAAGATVPLQNLTRGDWRPALAFWLLPAVLAALVWRPQRAGGGAGGGAPAPGRGLLRLLLRSRLAWQVTFFMGLQSALAYCVFGWLPVILIDRGMSPLAAGFHLSVSVAMQIPAALAGPWLAGLGRDQRAVIVLMMAMTAVGLAGSLYAPVGALWPWVVLLGFGQGGSFSVALTLLVLRSPDTPTAAALSGMAQGVGYSLAAFGPLAVGLLHDATGGWNAVALLLAAIVAAALAAGMGAGRDRLIAAAG